MPKIESDLIPPRKASKILGISTRTLYKWSVEGRIKSVVLPSGFRRYHKSDIQNIVVKDLVKDVSNQKKLSLSAIILLLWLYIKGLFR